MELARSLPDAFGHLARRHGRVEALVVGERSATWTVLADRARALALGLHDAGVAPGQPVVVALGPSIEAVVAEQAALAVGAVVELATPGAAPEGTARLDERGLHHDGGVLGDPELVDRGRAADLREPELYERLVAGRALDDAAVRAGAVTLTHAQVLGAVRSLSRDTLPAQLAAAAEDRPPVALVEGAWPDLVVRLVACWWPLVHGGTCVLLTGGRPAHPALVAARPDLVLADRATWSEVAGRLRGRVHRRRDRRLLGEGRALAAGESLGPVAAVLHPTLLGRRRERLLEPLGLDRCSIALSTAPVDEADRRDLQAVGVPLRRLWVPHEVAVPVTSTDPGGPVQGVGRPLPGWRVRLDDTGTVLVDGPGPISGRLAERGRLDPVGALHLREPRP